MRKHRSRAFVGAALLLLAGAGRAPDAAGAESNIGGDWHFRFSGERGAALLHFPGTPQFGVFQARGAGYTTLFASRPFCVSDDAPQTLAFDSTGRISGTLALEDATRTTTVGRLDVTGGRYDVAGDRVVLRAALSLDGEPAREVTLVGERAVGAAAGVVGRTLRGVLSGSRVSSARYDVAVTDDASAAIGEGYPFVALEAGGPARIDGAEVASTRLDALLVLSGGRRGQFCGRVSDSAFGPGVIRGRLVAGDPAAGSAPRLRATVATESGRRFRVSASLAN